MSKHRNLMTVCFAAAFALGLAACSSNDDPPAADMTGMTDTPAEPTAPAPATEIETAQADAAAAATAAMTASGDAATAAAAAMAAVANLATMQIGATAGGLADEAQAAADKAMAAYTHAKAASEDAAAAEEVRAAVEALVLAETAMANAVKYAATAAEKGTAAETAAMAELMIVGTVKTVGGTSLDAAAGVSTVTTDGNTVITGLIKSKNPMTMGKEATGVAFIRAMEEDAVLTDRDETKALAHVQAVAERPLTIGKVVDSDDDLARLIIVTHYAGSNSVKVYADADDSTGDGTDESTDLRGRLGSDGRIQTAGVGDDDVTNNVFVTLKSVGTYYEATQPGDTADNLVTRI